MEIRIIKLALGYSGISFFKYQEGDDQTDGQLDLTEDGSIHLQISPYSKFPIVCTWDGEELGQFEVKGFPEMATKIKDLLKNKNHGKVHI